MSNSMSHSRWLVVALTLSSFFGGLESLQAQDTGAAFLYGYGIGQTQRFQTRLPTPPYFSIHPPVYYGKRFERPYGDSPYAAWPTLQANPEYRPQLKRSPGVSISNPYCLEVGSEHPLSSPSPIAQNTFVPGKKVVIENPFVGTDMVAVP